MLENAPKPIHKWRRYHSSNCHEIDENVRFEIWRPSVAPSDAAAKNRIV